MLYVLNLGEEDAPRLHEIEEEYRNGPLQGRAQHRSHGDLRQDRSGAGGACRRRKRASIWSSYGLKESGLERLITATYSLLGSDVVSDGGRDRSARLDHPDRQHGGESRRRDPLAISRRNSSAPKW